MAHQIFTSLLYRPIFTKFHNMTFVFHCILLIRGPVRTCILAGLYVCSVLYVHATPHGKSPIQLQPFLNMYTKILVWWGPHGVITLTSRPHTTFFPSPSTPTLLSLPCLLVLSLRHTENEAPTPHCSSWSRVNNGQFMISKQHCNQDL